MNILGQLRNGWFVGGIFVVAIGFYAAFLQLRLSDLQRQIDALQQEKEAIQSVLAERDEQRALQKQLEAQLRQLAGQQQSKQQEELLRLRQQVQLIPGLRAENDQLKERLRQTTVFRPPPLPSRNSELSGSAPQTQPYAIETGVPAPAAATLTNIALGKPVISSVSDLYTGSLAQLTDGIKDPSQVVEFRRGTQFVQIDLEQEYPLYWIKVFHDSRDAEKIAEGIKFHDVIVQASSDPDFKENVRTFFNNDTDNSSGLGKGNDREYLETKDGKMISGQKFPARFVRLYSRGSTISAWNTYTEVEVFTLAGSSL